MWHRVRFWEEQWMEGDTLRDQYPRILTIMQQKDVKDM